MIILKNYFLSQNKLLWLLPIAMLLLSFYIHYEMVMNYQIDFFRHTNGQTREGILNAELSIYKTNLFMSLLVFISQVVFVILSLNIGLLLFGYGRPFKELSGLVIKSSPVLILIYFVSPTILFLSNDFFSFDALYRIESDFTLLRYVEKDSSVWLKNLLEMFSLTQLLFVLFLSLGFQYLMNWTYKKSLLWISKTYGILFMLWMSFAVIMDLNFYQ